MSDTALSEEALQASLRDIRLPPDNAGGWLADVLLVAGLAGLLALAVVAVLRLVTARRRPARLPSLADDLAALAKLPESEQRIALLHLLRTHAPERFEALRPELYRPGPAADLARLQAEVQACV